VNASAQIEAEGSAASATPVVRVEGITKHFPGVRALDNVTLELHQHEVLGLVGENGSGKSTLLKILAGVTVPDRGRIVVRGKPATYRSVAAALRAGIGMVFQEQALIPNVTVAENILLGAEDNTVRSGVYRWRELNRRAQTQLAKVNAQIEPSALTESLTFAERQLVELAKVLRIEERIGGDPVILLDEPTTVLEREEIETLFTQIDRLRASASIIFVSHRLDEVLRVSDRIYVMRDGRCVAELDPKTSDIHALHLTMVGRGLSDSYYREADQHPPTAAEPRLSVRGLTLPRHYEDVAFDVLPGEVVGIAGVQGSGREDVCRTLFGALAPKAGKILLDGRAVRFTSPAGAVKAGVGYVPAERRLEGIIGPMSVSENMTLAHIWRVMRGLLIDRAGEDRLAREWIDQLSIKVPSHRARAGNLSGGNQQKLSLAKWLISDRLKVLVLDHPTRGLDVGAKAEVYALVRELADRGLAMVLLADTLEETIALSHRIIVMKDGRIVDRIEAPQGAKPSQVTVVEKMV
jgi:ribose transport system ATP-binding protein